MKKHRFNIYSNHVDGGFRAVCVDCSWSATDDDKEALRKRASGHQFPQDPIPKTVPFKSGLRKDLWS